MGSVLTSTKCYECCQAADSCYFGVFEKLTCACYFQTALETMLLPILIMNYPTITRGIKFYKFTHMSYKWMNYRKCKLKDDKGVSIWNPLDKDQRNIKVSNTILQEKN